MRWYNHLRDAVIRANSDFQEKQFDPMMEGDFLARIYYHLLAQVYRVLAKKAFVKARIVQNESALPRANKYDSVIGRLRDIPSSVHTIRYAVPELVAECKVFPVGFRPQQLSNRRRGIQEDIEKL